MIKKALFLSLLLSLGYAAAQEYNVKSLEINNKLDHHAPVVVGNKIYFSCNLVNKRGKPVLDKYSGKIYGLYEGTVTENGEIENPQLITKTEKGQFNMSTATFTKDGKYMYFTTNNFHTGKNKSKNYDTYNLVIQRAEFIEGKGWTNFTTLPFCDTNYNYAHPAISPDGTTLYFISNVKGAKGKSDLYKVSVHGHETYGEIDRLNDTINSPRTELFPYVSNDNSLYFASNRRGGLGGLDIYKYPLNTNDISEKPEPLPEPVNSKGNDFSFFIFEDSKSGYFTSRRLHGKGGDDLFYFTID